jgi:hypothetical protein
MVKRHRKLFLNVGRNVEFTTHNIASTNLYLNQKSGKKQINTYNLSDRQLGEDQNNF